MCFSLQPVILKPFFKIEDQRKKSSNKVVYHRGHLQNLLVVIPVISVTVSCCPAPISTDTTSGLMTEQFKLPTVRV